MRLAEHGEVGATLEQLPELPQDVRVPDDLSGLPALPGPVDGQVRWIRWLTVVVMVGLVGVLGVMLLVSGQTQNAITMDPMDVYGTDNPVVVDEAAVPGSVTVVPAVDYQDLYGTDNPVIVGEADVPDVDGTSPMDLYGTDNPVIVGRGAAPGLMDTMDVYGTDNPYFVDRTWMDLYGTDNPDLGR